MTAPKELHGLTVSSSIPWDRFILLAGEAFSGKSTACASFPDPIFLDFDNKAPKGVKTIPFHSAAFCDTLVKRANPTLPPNKRDALMTWVERNMHLVPPDSTVILDALSSVDTWYHTQTEKVDGVQAAIGGGKLYGDKLKWFSSLCEILKMYPCRVIICAHLQPVFDAENRSTGKMKALVSGSFAEKIGTYCTSIIRAHVKTVSNNSQYLWRIKPDGVLNSNVPFQTLLQDVDVTSGAYPAMLKLIENV